MRVKTSILLVLFLISFNAFPQTKQICFTYDDMPIVSYGINDTISQQLLFTNIINTLKSNNVPATGFVNEIKLFENDKLIPFQKNLLQQWANAGLKLGNHTYSHHDYNNVTFKEFTADIVKGEKITKEILNIRKQQLQYFRHPYLHMGATKERADSLNNFLTQHNYIVAPVTIDNDDYLFASAYKKAMVKNDKALMSQIGNDFVNYIEQKVLYYEKQSGQLFARNMRQILLLHLSQLNSDYADELISMLKKHRYEFISLEKALQDPAYATAISVFDKRGISWIDRWALSMGKDREFFKNDPVPPTYIVDPPK